MNKKETPMTVAYWDEVGGTLIEEFRVVNRCDGQAQRLVDAIILLDEPKVREESGKRVDLTGKNVAVVQTKAQRLGMSLLGQAYFSKLLVLELGAKSVRSVALCTEDDSVLHRLAEAHGVVVVVRPASARATT